MNLKLRTLCLTSITFTAGVALAGLLLLLPHSSQARPDAPTRANPDVLYVAPGGDDANTCITFTVPCRTVQAAVDKATAGDVVRVASGVYTGVSARAGITQVVYIGKSVTIQGGYTTTNWMTPYPITQPTTLDAQGNGRVIYVVGNISPTIEGIYITGGDASGLRGYAAYWPENYDAGGGVYVYGAAAILSGCFVYSNTAQWGGGVYLEGSRAEVSGNVIFSNTAWSGGGVSLVGSDAAVMSGNVILSNAANDAPVVINGGGGVYLESSSAALSGNVIQGNTTAGKGGGVYILFVGTSPVTLINNVITDNRADSGGGMYIGGNTRAIHTTLARNVATGDDSGVYVTATGPKLVFPTTVAMTNTILVSHTVGISVAYLNTLALNGVLWYGTPITIAQEISTPVTVRNQHTGTPAFAADGYHLTSESAAIDRGVSSNVNVDIDDNPRPSITGSDLGADEFPVALRLVKHATPNPAQTGALLTYTLRVSNTGSVDLHATVTDTLPTHVTTGTTSGGTLFVPGGTITWTPLVTAPDGVWTQQVVVTVEMGYVGPLTNVVQITTMENASSVYTETALVIKRCPVYLPLVLRRSP